MMETGWGWGLCLALNRLSVSIESLKEAPDIWGGKAYSPFTLVGNTVSCAGTRYLGTCEVTLLGPGVGRL